MFFFLIIPLKATSLSTPLYTSTPLSVASTTTFGDPFSHINTQNRGESLPGAELWVREGWQGGSMANHWEKSLGKATTADPSPGDVCNPPHLEHSTMSPSCTPLFQTSQRTSFECCFVQHMTFPFLPVYISACF